MNSIAIIIGRGSCLVMMWDLLSLESKQKLKELASMILHIDAYKLLVSWENGNRSPNDYFKPEMGDQYIAMGKRLQLVPSQRYHVLRAAIRLALVPLATVVAASVVLGVVLHARKVVLANIFGTFADDNYAALDGARLIVVWMALGLVIPVQMIVNSKKESLMAQIQDTVTAKAVELYIAKSTGGSFAKGIQRGVGNTIFEFRFALSGAMDLLAEVLAQTLNIYVVVATVGWRSLIPIAVGMVDAGAKHLMQTLKKEKRKAKKIATQPDFKKDFEGLIASLRAIKFYAWESLFLHGESFSNMPEPLPLLLRLFETITVVLGGVLPEICSALVLISYVSDNSRIAYVDVAIILQSMSSLMHFTKSLSAIPIHLLRLRDTEELFHGLYRCQELPRISAGVTDKPGTVIMDKCTFSWGPDKFALEPLTLEISAGEFITVVGRIGSGKSSLLTAICGEMPMVSGSGHVNGNIGYVSQRPWIMNATFRDNVLLGNAFDKERYNKVIEACALTEDTKHLPAGDLTEIGPRGINLSGGQNVRLALARAIYTDADIFVLDDILSAVDVEVGRHIVENVLAGEGLLGGKTRILVTHADYIVPLSDRVIEISKGRAKVSDQAGIRFKATTEEPPKAAAGGHRKAKGLGGSGEFTMAPEITIPPFNQSAIVKFLSISGYFNIAMCIAIQFACAFSYYYIERTRIQLMSNSGAFLDKSTVKQYLLVGMSVAIARGTITEFGNWLRSAMWLTKVMGTMQQMLLGSLLHTPLAVVERLPRHVLTMLFFSELAGVALMVPREVSRYTNKVAGELLTLSILVWMKWCQCAHGQSTSPSDVHVIVDLAQGTLSNLSTLTVSNASMAMFLPVLAKFFAYVEGLPREAAHEISECRPPPSWPNNGIIEVKGYSMRYRDDQDDVLRNISFTTRPFEKIGVVGRTGAGKSSLIHALLRLTEPSAGSVVVDGIDISTIGLNDLRSQISVVPQNPVLFEGTIRENLDPKSEYSDKELWAAIRAARIEDMVSVPSDKYIPGTSEARAAGDDAPGPWAAGVGLDKWVEADGRNFSMGQRQLICLCRVLLWRRRILILDEATANIDSHTDGIIQSVLREEFKSCTVITIAHRLNTVMDSDRIIVMDHGEVVEFDTPANLRAQGGRFVQLVESMEYAEKAQ
ncbi:Canalicular multispecific organic anion transporter 1 [Coemansia biformis]|uniref:Canalicular multispecific organic anion transporter 1 n=1 Tax=Coemansia biformis TaxID=1286918 RepID=A0A9W7YDQ5_9FUNG|nr:Canalicular multispecific organic anion transporter 1 [Coemansia biformis]